MDEIRVGYAAMENGYLQMQAISRRMDDRLAALRADLQRMHWEGSDREQYQVHQGQWDSAVADINRLLHEIGAAVAVAKDNYASTERQNAGLWT